VGENVVGGALTAVPSPILTIAPTTNWYLVKRALGVSSECINTLDVLFRPTALGIFSYDGWLGAGDWQLNLTPNVNYANTMLQTQNGNVCSVSVTNVRLYICTMRMEIPDQITTLHLREFQVQQKPLQAVNLTFTVPPSSEMLYVFLQSTLAGTSTIWPPSQFSTVGDLQNNVTALQITYANVTKPMTRWTSGYVAPAGGAVGATPAFNGLVQFYAQHNIELGKATDGAGVESFNEWLNRGALYSFNFIRDSADRSTEIQLQIECKTQANGAPDLTGTTQVFVASEFRRVVQMTQSQGMITEVRSLNT
jgi:hypothetical protein